MNQVLAEIETYNLKQLAGLRHNPEFKSKPITISRIQWHLRMGYNMSCRLLVDAFKDGILVRIKDNPTAGFFSENGCFHKQCHDCGCFIKKDRWVDKSNRYKFHALCLSCLSDYDCTECDNTM